MAGFFDGLFEPDGRPRAACAEVALFLDRTGIEGLRELQRDADLSLLNQGITFTVYADQRGTEKIFPFDMIPRIVTADRWARLEAGLRQRNHALNLFLDDLYGEQRALRENVVPTELVLGSPNFCRAMMGVKVPRGVYVHISGTDLIENEEGDFLVLEDNVRVPSGVSYVLENRIVMSRVLPDLLARHHVRPVDHYPRMLLDALRGLSTSPDPVVVVLTPGIYNSAYYEHSYLAAQMGVQLVEGRDLVVDEDKLYMKTTSGLQRVDVVYRRIDDDFLDPLAFRADSVLGVPGILNAYRAGNVALANAPGTGVVDDKAMYAYVPDVIRFFLSEEPILGQVPTYLGRRSKDLAYMSAHLDELVVKPTDGSGGYGLLVGSAATRAEIEEMRRTLALAGDRFVAQPIQRLSTLPTLVGDAAPEIAPRHVDLRPFSISRDPAGAEVLPGGLTRVALREGSLVVNSSQGGGSKDTWVLQAGAGA
ncbi:MAG: circularly permuted type 2 ATP-grasp protein [Myxococcota bacterium]